MSNFIIENLSENHLAPVAEIHRLSRIESERGIIIDCDLTRDTAPWFEKKWMTWHADPEIFTHVATENGAVVGFSTFGRVKTRPCFDQGVVPKFGGEIYAIYVHPDHFRKGIGRALFKAACESLSAQKINSLLLWVLKKNKRACGLYTTLKGERVAKQRVDIGTKSWAEESCFSWRDTRKISFT